MQNSNWSCNNELISSFVNVLSGVSRIRLNVVVIPISRICGVPAQRAIFDVRAFGVETPSTRNVFSYDNWRNCSAIESNFRKKGVRGGAPHPQTHPFFGCLSLAWVVTNWHTTKFWKSKKHHIYKYSGGYSPLNSATSIKSIGDHPGILGATQTKKETENDSKNTNLLSESHWVCTRIRARTKFHTWNWWRLPTCAKLNQTV